MAFNHVVVGSSPTVGGFTVPLFYVVLFSSLLVAREDDSLLIDHTSRLIVVNESCFKGFVFCDDGFLLQTATERPQMAMIS